MFGKYQLFNSRVIIQKPYFGHNLTFQNEVKVTKFKSTLNSLLTIYRCKFGFYSTTGSDHNVKKWLISSLLGW